MTLTVKLRHLPWAVDYLEGFSWSLSNIAMWVTNFLLSEALTMNVGKKKTKKKNLLKIPYVAQQ